MWTEPNKFMYFTHLRPKPINLNVNKVIVSQFEVNDLAQKIFKWEHFDIQTIHFVAIN